LHAELAEHGKVVIEVEGKPLELGPEELAIQVEAAPGFAAETGRIGVVVLHTTLTEKLIDEGLVRELLSRVQAARKDRGYEFTDRIELRIDGDERLVRVARASAEEIGKACLATTVLVGSRGDGAEKHDLGDAELWLSVKKAESADPSGAGRPPTRQS
jgi:isoleucyl-tRNA synthetase